MSGRPDPRDPQTWDPEMRESHERWVAAGRPNMLDFIADDVFRSKKAEEAEVQAALDKAEREAAGTAEGVRR